MLSTDSDAAPPRGPLIIRHAPDPVLKQKAAPVAAVDARITRLMEDMLQTMYAERGIGLAAPQVGVSERVIVVDVGWREREDGSVGQTGTPLKMANPELIWLSEEDATFNEGCLSVPDHYGDVVRPAGCTVRYLDETGATRELTAEGLLATCIQHEIDHLDGILFIDHLSALKRNMIMRKLVKAKKAAA